MAYSLTAHASQQVESKGFDAEAVLRAANDPHVSYDNGRYPGQRRHIREGVCAVVRPDIQKVMTVYVHQDWTAPRLDQIDRDAQVYRQRFNQRFGN